MQANILLHYPPSSCSGITITKCGWKTVNDFTPAWESLSRPLLKQSNRHPSGSAEGINSVYCSVPHRSLNLICPPTKRVQWGGVMGLHGEVLVAGGRSGWAIGVASLRSCEKLLPCLINPVPAGSKMDPPLAKAKPIRDSGSASGIT